MKRQSVFEQLGLALPFLPSRALAQAKQLTYYRDQGHGLLVAREKGSPIGAFVNRHKRFLPQLFLVFFVELFLLSDSAALGSDSNLGLLLFDYDLTAL